MAAGELERFLARRRSISHPASGEGVRLGFYAIVPSI
jgi:hypothetical protein